MKTLFLKSNILHIRTNEGEFEVSNPEVFYSYTVKTGVTVLDFPEWPHGVERVSDCSCQVNKTRCWGPCGADTTVKIRLLPEDKKHEWTTDEIMSMVEKKPAKPTESSYKEFGPHLPCVPAKKEPNLERLAGKLKPNYNHAQRIKPVESSEPQEELKKGDAGFKWFTCPTCDGRGSVPQDSAPSESQEEMYNEVRQEYLKHRGRIWTKEEVMLKWIIENYKLITRKPE